MLETGAANWYLRLTMCSAVDKLAVTDAYPYEDLRLFLSPNEAAVMSWPQKTQLPAMTLHYLMKLIPVCDCATS